MRKLKLYTEFINESKTGYRKESEPKYVKINGLDKLGVDILLHFMSTKLSDDNYIEAIEFGGNDCDMSWIKDSMDISGEDMVHELFEIYGDNENGLYTLTIDMREDILYMSPNVYIYSTHKIDEDWSDEYKYIVKSKKLGEK